MTEAHILAAVLATWRIVLIIHEDRVGQPIRWLLTKLRLTFVLSCSRCLSWWVGVALTLGFYFAPFLAWPFALSMSFMLFELLSDKRTAKIILRPAGDDIQVQLVRTTEREAMAAIATLATRMKKKESK